MIKQTFKIGGELEANRLGYGAMRLTGQPGNYGPYPDWEQGLALLRHANDLGVTAGVLAAINYLAELGRVASGNENAGRLVALQDAYQAIGAYEDELMGELLTGLADLESVTIYGISDVGRMSERLPTVSILWDCPNASSVLRDLFSF